MDPPRWFSASAPTPAALSDGSFVYVPEGVRCPMELSTYFRINEKNTGQFERTLIIADKGSYVSYLEGCTAPIPAHRRDMIALKTVYDPEIPADIHEIGLIYRIDVADDRNVKVDMSLTSSNCPSAQELPVMVQNAVSTVPGAGKVDVSVVWDPPWDPSRMSEEARVVLNTL